MRAELWSTCLVCHQDKPMHEMFSIGSVSICRQCASVTALPSPPERQQQR